MLTEKQKEQANRACVLSLLSYLDLSLFRNKFDEPILPNLDSFISKRNSYNSKFSIKDRFLNKDTFNFEITLKDLFLKGAVYKGTDNLNDYMTVKNTILESKELQEIKIVNLSTLTSFFSKNTLEALTVQYKNELYIIFRGTGAGKWLDNGMGLYTTSEMQLKAADYVRKMEKIYGDQKKIILAGHSKGGNLAQSALMLSGIGSKIEHVYSFDGQGFSSEAYNQFKEKTNFESLRSKITQIADANDFVSPLGIPIVKPENTIYIDGYKNLDTHPHSLDTISDNGKILFDKQISQGPVGILMKMISDRLIKEGRDITGHCSLSLMGICERVMPYKNKAAKELHHQGSGFIKKSTPYDLKILLQKGLPIIEECLKTEQGKNAINELKEYKAIPYIGVKTVLNILEIENRTKIFQSGLFFVKEAELPEINDPTLLRLRDYAFKIGLMYSDPAKEIAIEKERKIEKDNIICPENSHEKKHTKKKEIYYR